MLRALVFDVDGTLADTEEAHRDAFNRAFAQEQLDWQWDSASYTSLLGIAGGKERILHFAESLWGQAAGEEAARRMQLATRVHAIKNAIYAESVNGGRVSARPGVLELMHAAQSRGLKLAIATTTSASNVDALLKHFLGANWRSQFAAVEDASTAPLKKPHPQVYLQALQGLRLSATNCVALEDSANGLQAARAAGIACVITPNAYTAHHNFGGALRVLPNLVGIGPHELDLWLATARGLPPVVPATSL